MRLPPELLVDGCVRTLQQDVLPGLASRYARGQLYAVLDVLQNLRDRIEEKHAFAEAEAASAESALVRAAEALRAAGAAADADAIAAGIGAAPATPGGARRDAMNETFALALARVAALPGGEGEAARAALGGHIGAQALRDLAGLRPSLLEEISRG